MNISKKKLDLRKKETKRSYYPASRWIDIKERGIIETLDVQIKESSRSENEIKLDHPRDSPMVGKLFNRIDFSPAGSAPAAMRALLGITESNKSKCVAAHDDVRSGISREKRFYKSRDYPGGRAGVRGQTRTLMFVEGNIAVSGRYHRSDKLVPPSFE